MDRDTTPDRPDRSRDCKPEVAAEGQEAGAGADERRQARPHGRNTGERASKGSSGGTWNAPQQRASLQSCMKRKYKPSLWMAGTK
eukprot:183510-Chlamydomonas_euryale.AAC.1